MPFVRRPIDRTELLVADELAVCGTLAELVLVESIEGLPLNPNSHLLRRLQDRFFRAARNIDPHPAVELTPCSLANTSTSRAAETEAGALQSAQV